MFKAKQQSQRIAALNTKYLPAKPGSSASLKKKTQPIHCRSLVDLSPQQFLASTNKENNAHYSSVSSHRDEHSLHKITNNNAKAAPVENRSSSNIARLLKAAQNPKKTAFDKKALPHNQVESKLETPAAALFGKDNGTALPQKRQRQNPTFTYNIEKQLRTSSQTSLQTVQQEAPKKNVKPQQNNPHNMSRNDADYNLLLKLKDYIEQLKTNEEKLMQKINNLSADLSQSRDACTLLEDKVKVQTIREQEMVRKIKSLQKRQEDRRGGKTCENCQENSLVIQSLKNVINEQLTKIIQLERNRLEAIAIEQNEKNRHQNNPKKAPTSNINKPSTQNHLHHQKKQQQPNKKGNPHTQNNSYLHENSLQSMNDDIEESFMSAANNHRQNKSIRIDSQPETYSFKKNFHHYQSDEKQSENRKHYEGINENDEQSEYSPEQSLGAVDMKQLELYKVGHQNQEYQKYGKEEHKEARAKGSMQGVPEPYSLILQGMKSDSHNSRSQSSRAYHQEEDDNESEFSEQYSQDGILQEVGNYLSNIRSNIRDKY